MDIQVSEIVAFSTVAAVFFLAYVIVMQIGVHKHRSSGHVHQGELPSQVLDGAGRGPRMSRLRALISERDALLSTAADVPVEGVPEAVDRRAEARTRADDTFADPRSEIAAEVAGDARWPEAARARYSRAFGGPGQE